MTPYSRAGQSGPSNRVHIVLLISGGSCCHYEPQCSVDRMDRMAATVAASFHTDSWAAGVRMSAGRSKVPDATPIISLLAESGTIRTKWRVWIEKIQLVNKIHKQDLDSLVRNVYIEQLQHGWPGLATEVTSICKQIGIPDVNRNVVQKDKIKEAILYHHYKDLKENINKYKKMERIKHQDFPSMQL